MISYIKPLLSILKYKLKIKKKRIKISKKTIDQNIKLLVDKIKLNGFAIIPNYVNQKDCEEIISKINNCIASYKEKIWSDSLSSDQRIFGSEIISEKITKFFNDQNLLNVGESYTNYKIKNLMTMANKVSYIKNNEGSGGGWHKDAYYTQFKSILYLTDVNSENGPFELIRNSNKILETLKIAFKLRKGYPNTRFSNEEILNLKPKKIDQILGSAGTLILVDTSIVHRGSPIKSGNRYALTNYYVPEDNYENLKKQFSPWFSFN
jgi:hypothetical protein